MTTVCTNLIPESIYEKLPGQISWRNFKFPGVGKSPPATCLNKHCLHQFWHTYTDAFNATVATVNGLLAQLYLLPANSTSYSYYNKCLVHVISSYAQIIY